MLCAALRCAVAALRCAVLRCAVIHAWDPMVCLHSCKKKKLSRSRHPAHNPDATLTVEDLAIIMADATNRDREK